jgi:hypothetical protein
MTGKSKFRELVECLARAALISEMKLSSCVISSHSRRDRRAKMA